MPNIAFHQLISISFDNIYTVKKIFTFTQSMIWVVSYKTAHVKYLKRINVTYTIHNNLSSTNYFYHNSRYQATIIGILTIFFCAYFLMIHLVHFCNVLPY